MSDSEVAKITASLELDDSDFKDQMDDDKSLAEDFKDILDEVTDTTLDVDASGATDALQEATDSVNEFKDATDEIEDTSIDGDASGYVGATQEASSATNALEEEVSSLKDMMATAFEVVEVGAAIAALSAVGDEVVDLTQKYADLEDTAQRAAMMGGTSAGQMPGATADVYQQAEQMGVQYGLEPGTLASGIGMARTYGMPFSTSEAQMAAGMKLDPTTVAQVVQATSAATGISDTQQIADIYSKAYMQTGLDPSSVAMRAIQMLGPNQLGGFTGQVATFEKMQQVMPDVQPAMVASTIDTFTKQVDTGAKALTQVLAEAGLGTVDTTSTTSKAGKTTTKTTYDASAELQKDPMQILQDLSETGQKQGKDYFQELASGRSGGILRQLGENQAGIKDYKNGLDNASGSTEDLYNKTDDLQRSMVRMDTAFGEMSTETGSLFEGPMEDLSNFISGPMLQSWDSMIGKIKSGDLRGAVQDALNLGSQIQQAVNSWFSNISWSTVGQELKDGFQTVWESAISEVGAATSWDSLFAGLNGLGSAVMAAIGPTLMYAFEGMVHYAEGPIVTLETSFDMLGNDGARAFQFVDNAANMLADDIGGNLLGAIGSVLTALGSLVGAASGLDAVGTSVQGLLDSSNAKLGDANTGKGMTSIGPFSEPANWQNPQLHTMGWSDPNNPDYLNSNGQTISIGGENLGSTPLAGPYTASGAQSYDDSQAHKSVVLNGGDDATAKENELTEAKEEATQYEAAHNQVVSSSTPVQQDQTQAVQSNIGPLHDLANQLMNAGSAAGTLANQYTQNAADIAAGKKDTIQPSDWNADYAKNKEQYENAANDEGYQLYDLGELPEDIIPTTDPLLQELSGSIQDLGTQSAQTADATSKANTNLKSTTVGFDALGDAMQGMSDYMSAFGNWQEQNASSLFFGAYTGPSSGYQAWLDQQPTSPLGRPAVQNEGINYNETNQLVPIKLDDIEATSSLTTFQDKATTTQKVPLQLDDYAAQSSLTNDQDTAQQPQTMPIKADGSSAEAVIAALKADAEAGATMPIYASGGSSGGLSQNTGNPYIDTPNTGNPYIDTPNINLLDYLQNFDEGGIVGGDVGRPTLAIVHGGEQVLAPGQMAGGGQPIVVNYNPVINGSGLSQEALQAVLAANNIELMRQVELKATHSQWR